MGGVLLGVLTALAAAAACVLVLTDDQRLLRLGIVAALWAALVGAFAAARHRRDVAAGLDRTDELRQVYQLELEREVAARREHELQVETDARRRAEDGVRGELDGLRSEMCALRQNLEALLGGGVLVERVALRAESTRLRSLTDQSRARSADRALPHGTLDATPVRSVASPSEPGAVPSRHDSRPLRPTAADVPATEVFPRYPGPGPRRHDSRPIDVSGRSGPRPSDSRPIEVSGRSGPRPSDSRPIDTGGRFAPPQPRMHDSGPIDLARGDLPRGDLARGDLARGDLARGDLPRGPRPSDSRPIDVNGRDLADQRPSRPPHQPPPADTGRWSVVAGTAPVGGDRPAPARPAEQPPRQWADFDSWVADPTAAHSAADGTASASTDAARSAASPDSGGRRRRADLQSVDSPSDSYVGRRRRADEDTGGRSVDEMLASYRADDAEPRRRRRAGA